TGRPASRAPTPTAATTSPVPPRTGTPTRTCRPATRACDGRPDATRQRRLGGPAVRPRPADEAVRGRGHLAGPVHAGVRRALHPVQVPRAGACRRAAPARPAQPAGPVPDGRPAGRTRAARDTPGARRSAGG